MNPLPRPIVFLLLTLALLTPRLLAVPKTEAGVRRELVQTLLSHGPERHELLHDLARSGSKVAASILTSWTRGEIYAYRAPDGKVIPVTLEDQEDANGRARAIRVDTGAFLVDAKGKVLKFDDSTLDTIDTDMRLRMDIQQAIDVLSLASPVPDERRSSAVKLGNSGKMAYLPYLEERLPEENVSTVRRAIKEAIATLKLGSPDPSVQIAAARSLARLNALGAVDVLTQFVANKSADPGALAAARIALHSIQEHISLVNFFGTLFRGVSLGSILLVVSLGLAITFGLMGVINMAHGEMIAVGAYTAYLVENLFGSGITLPFFGLGLHVPGFNAAGSFYESNFLFAIPASFVTAAIAGVVLERLVIRFLYRRPLESLLATWGVSLVMQQGFRMVFGANNVQVDSPSWLLGHFSINDVMFGYNRVFVVGFAIAIVIGTWLLLTKTPLGLLIRSVMQNRRMASCMGVRTDWVNMLTFAFGSGLAGLAGAFLSQIGNVGPSMGQTYIVDSFMVVVVGGVGSIVGTVFASLGMGSADQVLQQVLGSPVLGKILVLCFIILFLQWKPGGLFATRSRNLD
ncbi:high-affinity branched-chain amino acid transport system permease protein LivH [mine drainage metagenome]|uniref:High-affinity branched-chain amino acid transport system permease protein LivH n=1 Tax=mine drainage metagenome TaxID=410659 RepID=A0A1J5S7W7_9ZZZZ